VCGAGEWQYYIKGKARMGVFNTGPQVLTMDFNPGDTSVAAGENADGN
jgi:oxalate decarboxylase/phosphoglucose isomerase-like protein (cupin superfamily)